MPSPVYSVCEYVYRHISLGSVFIAFVYAIEFVRRAEVENTRTLNFPIRSSLFLALLFLFSP